MSGAGLRGMLQSGQLWAWVAGSLPRLLATPFYQGSPCCGAGGAGEPTYSGNPAPLRRKRMREGASRP
jgi:hypothetical protein